MRPEEIRKRIAAGETITNREPGNSMLPLIKSRQPCELRPITRELHVGDIVYCKVKGRYYTHLIHAIQGDRYLIGNNRGGTNGWTRDVIALVQPL